MKSFSTLCILSAFVASAAAHGVVTNPLPRQPGPAALSACGAGAYGVLTKGKIPPVHFAMASLSDNEWLSDLTAPIEEAVAAADADFDADACHAFFCRGLQREDNVRPFYGSGEQKDYSSNVVISARQHSRLCSRLDCSIQRHDQGPPHWTC
jgi:hypothetical protein